MTGKRTRARTSWPQELRDEAIRIGRERGARAASEATGAPVGTVRSWLARSASDDCTVLHESKADDGPLTISDWISHQRAEATRHRAALAQGKSGRDHLMAMAIADTKIRELKREGAQVDDAERAESLVELIKREFPDVVPAVDRVALLEVENERLRGLLRDVPVGALADVDHEHHDPTDYALAAYVVLSHLDALVVEDAGEQIAVEEATTEVVSRAPAEPRSRVLAPGSTRLTFGDGRSRRLTRRSIQHQIGGLK